jgi:hypothetical protein
LGLEPLPHHYGAKHEKARMHLLTGLLVFGKASLRPVSLLAERGRYLPLARAGVWQLGKKVLAMIFAACALVTGLPGRKYGLFSSSHFSPGPPHG